MKNTFPISILFLLVVLTTKPPLFAQHTKSEPVVLKWLDKQDFHQPTAVSWGVPWPQGLVNKRQNFSLVAANGKSLPLQSWPMAYWPDGTVKWSGFSTVAEAGSDGFELSRVPETANPKADLILADNKENIKISSGGFSCIIPKKGNILLDSIILDERMVGGEARLEVILQNAPDGDVYDSPEKQKYSSKITQVLIEQKGPVRAVVKVDGVMESDDAGHTFLPFSVRLYFYAGTSSIRLVNTVIYDGDQEKDFIKGLGMVFTVPMEEEMHNRHVRFAGEGEGVWAEPVRPLLGRRVFSYEGENVFPDQVVGKAIPPKEKFSPDQQKLIDDLPVWNDYKLVQNNADGFTIHKRTNDKSTWLDANAGTRSSGLAFVGDTNGGISVGLKDFWQSYPAALEIKDAATDEATLKVWLWSPFAEAMDMRHYDTVAHGLEATYEDVQEGLSTPFGIARTSELTLFASSQIPTNEEISGQAKISSQTPLLVADPEYYHTINTFGIWSLPDRSTPAKVWIEDRLEANLNFYKKEIDQRNWYGFWNYGDVMHAYDPVRHTWRYDIGGYAWDNTELASDFWLWYSFLRTGRSDVFRMAEAMARHTSEVDVYHIGELAGLGSRHNVRHWGDGSKEVRESQAASRRFYYYLTTDERTGDIMREVAQTADIAMTNLDPLRLILPPTTHPTHARIGPDWLALVGNWMTEWERTGDKRWLDKIMSGVNSFSKMPHGFYSGKQAAFGYNPDTQKMYKLNDELGHSHLSVLMGGPEVVYELIGLMPNAKLEKLWMQFSKLWGAPPEEVEKAFGKSVDLGVKGAWYARMPAYVAYKTKDPMYAARAWEWFLSESSGIPLTPATIAGPDALKPLIEAPKVSTNHTAQWSLNAIQLLEFVGDKIPQELIPEEQKP